MWEYVISDVQETVRKTTQSASGTGGGHVVMGTQKPFQGASVADMGCFPNEPHMHHHNKELDQSRLDIN